MQAEEVRNAGVVGYGLMGSGIAEVLAAAGIDVVVLEPTEALLAAGRERLEASTARAVARGKMEGADRAAVPSGSTAPTKPPR
jgi:3-hydroxybutyryl-CoA dehydrogenase